MHRDLPGNLDVRPEVSSLRSDFGDSQQVRVGTRVNSAYILAKHLFLHHYLRTEKVSLHSPSIGFGSYGAEGT